MNETITTCPVCGESACRERYPNELVGRFPTVDYNFSPETRLTYQILDCLTCNHQFAVPPIDIKGLYSETHDEVYLSSKSQRQRSASDWLSIVQEYAPNAKSLIDIGCSVGIFLDSASEYFDVHGVELSTWAAEIAAKRHSVSLSPLSSSPPEQRFDIATMWGVIEHLEDPKREVNAIQNALSEGGVFFVYTGNRRATLPRLLGKKWWWYQGMHIQYFSKVSLGQLLTEAGFEVIATRNLPIYFSLASLAQSLKRYRSAVPLVRLLQTDLLANRLVRITLSGEMLMVARVKEANQ